MTKVRLTAVVNGNSQANAVTGGQVATDATDGSLSGSVGVVNRATTGSDRRAGSTDSIADLHTLDREASVDSLDVGDIETRPAVVGSGAEVELTPGGGVATVRVSGDGGALGGGPATLGVIIEGDVDGGAGRQSKSLAGVTVPAVHVAIGTVLVPDGDSPVVGVVTLELGDVLVLVGVGGGDLNDVGAVGVANVTGVGHVAAGGAGDGAESRGGGSAGGGEASPGGVGGRRGSRRSSGSGGAGLAALEALRTGGSEGAGSEACEEQDGLGELHFDLRD